MSDSPKTKTDRILSIAAVLTSITAVSVSVWSGCQNRSHNRLSVKPDLSILSHRTSADPEIGLRIENKGSGSALVKSWDISVDGKPLGSGHQGWTIAVQKLQGINQSWIHFGAYPALRAGESLPIFWVRPEEWEKLGTQDREEFIKSVRRIRVAIKYESVYEESMSTIFDGSRDW
jgi:hypothetical protein